MKSDNIQKMRECLEDFRNTYSSKYLDHTAPVTANDLEELARDVFYVLSNIVDEIEESSH